MYARPEQTRLDWINKVYALHRDGGTDIENKIIYNNIN